MYGFQSQNPFRFNCQSVNIITTSPLCKSNKRKGWWDWKSDKQKMKSTPLKPHFIFMKLFVFSKSFRCLFIIVICLHCRDQRKEFITQKYVQKSFINPSGHQPNILIEVCFFYCFFLFLYFYKLFVLFVMVCCWRNCKHN